MKSQRFLPLMASAALLGLMTSHLSAQDADPAPGARQGTDTVQLYAPSAIAAPTQGPSSTITTTTTTTTPSAAAPPAAPAPAAIAPAPAAAAPAPAAAAPAVAPAAAAPPPRTVGQMLGFIDVIPARAPERIQRQLDLAKIDAREADASRASASEMRGKTKGLIEVKKQEISGIDARMKVADKSKQETEKIMLGAEKKVAERQKEVLERREALHAAEIEEAKVARRLADASTRALDLELQLAQRRQSRPKAPAAEPTAVIREDAVIRELERKTLEAKQHQAQAQKDLAAKDEDIAKRRLELYRAQTAASGTSK